MDEKPVEWVGPDGESLGQLSVQQAYDELLVRLERMLDERNDPAYRLRVESCLERLRSWIERVAG
jgi:hypothetical protein